MSTDRPQKITFGEMREMGVRGLLSYCADYRCSHSIAISADHWPDDLRLSDIEPRFTCRACGKCGADVAAGFQLDQPTDQDDGLSVGTNNAAQRSIPCSPVLSPNRSRGENSAP